MLSKGFIINSYLSFGVLMEVSVIIPTLLPYIQSLVTKEDQATFIYSLTLSCFALVQVIASVSVGYLSRLFGMKPVYIMLCGLWLTGEIIYALAEWPLESAWAIFIGKVLAGTGTGLYSIGLSYLSITITDDSERSKAIATYRALTIFATIPSSLLAVVFAIPALSFAIGDYDINAFTYPPLFNIILISSCFILIVVFLDNVKDIKKPVPESKELQQGNFNKKPKVIYMSKGSILGYLIILLNGIIASTLSYAVPIVMIDAYGWSVFSYTIVFVFIALVNTTFALLVRTVTKLMKTKRFLIIVPCLGVLVIMCGICSVTAAGANSFQPGIGTSFFLLGTFGIYGSYQLEHTLMSTIFSSITPREFIVRMMPFTSVLYSLGKFIGPLLCETEETLLGLGLIYYDRLLLCGIMFFLTFIFGNYFYSEDLSRKVIVIEETRPLIISNEEDKN